VPPSWPEYQASRREKAIDPTGHISGLPEVMTTITRLLIAAIFSMSSFCPGGRDGDRPLISSPA
jgi:hypothetical protein